MVLLKRDLFTASIKRRNDYIQPISVTVYNDCPVDTVCQKNVDPIMTTPC